MNDFDLDEVLAVTIAKRRMSAKTRRRARLAAAAAAVGVAASTRVKSSRSIDDEGQRIRSRKVTVGGRHGVSLEMERSSSAHHSRKDPDRTSAVKVAAGPVRFNRTRVQNPVFNGTSKVLRVGRRFTAGTFRESEPSGRRSSSQWVNRTAHSRDRTPRDGGGFNIDHKITRSGRLVASREAMREPGVKAWQVNVGGADGLTLQRSKDRSGSSKTGRLWGAAGRVSGSVGRDGRKIDANIGYNGRKRSRRYGFDTNAPKGNRIYRRHN